MKTSEKLPQKRYGAYQAVVVKKLKKSGLKGKSLQLAIDAVLRRGPELVVLSRKNIRAINKKLNKHGAVVVKISTTGAIRLWTMNGFKNRQQQGAANLAKGRIKAKAVK